MQEQFEFNAPKIYQFLAEHKQKDPSDFSLNLTDPNDYWFMVTHVEVSPHKEENSDEEAEPVKRPRVEPNGREQTQQEPSQQIPTVIPTRPKGKISRKTEPPHRQVKLAPVQERASKRQANEKIRQQERISSKPHEQAEKRALRRNQSMGALSKSRKEDAKDNRPCPFPPRIQREWEKNSKRQWYSLSPESKIEAEKKMGALKQEKEGKGNPEKRKDKKELRFKF